MSFVSNKDKVIAIQNGLDSPFWKEWLLLEVQGRAKSTLNALATKASADDDIKRGWFQALQWVINLPAVVIAQHEMEEEEASREAARVASEEDAVRFGRNAPFRVVEPGELKEEDRSTRSEGE